MFKVNGKYWVILLAILFISVILYDMNGGDAYIYASGDLEYVATIKLNDSIKEEELEGTDYNFCFYESADEALRKLESYNEISRAELDDISDKLDDIEYTYVIISKYKGNAFLYNKDGSQSYGYIGLIDRRNKATNKIYVYTTNVECIPIVWDPY